MRFFTRAEYLFDILFCGLTQRILLHEVTDDRWIVDKLNEDFFKQCSQGK